MSFLAIVDTQSGGRAVRAARALLGLSASKLARKVHVAHGTIKKMEAKERFYHLTKKEQKIISFLRWECARRLERDIARFEMVVGVESAIHVENSDGSTTIDFAKPIA